jgi:hypothetical protein
VRALCVRCVPSRTSQRVRVGWSASSASRTAERGPRPTLTDASSDPTVLATLGAIVDERSRARRRCCRDDRAVAEGLVQQAVGTTIAFATQEASAMPTSDERFAAEARAGASQLRANTERPNGRKQKRLDSREWWLLSQKR